MAKKPANTREYFASLSSPQRAVMTKLRRAIQLAAPAAEERFSYGIPGFRLNGRPLVWFAAWREHYSLYPITPALLRSHAIDVSKFETSKGTIRFSADKPLPLALIKKLVKARLAELAA